MSKLKTSPDTPAAAAGIGGLVVVSSPSGAGKSTLTRALLAADPLTRLSISATTRPMRPGEEQGVHYDFVDDAQFDQMIADGDFLEWAHVFERRYGTPRARVEAWLNDGLDVIFDIDWQGARQVSASGLGRVTSVFILPPSLEELERRLRTRGSDDEAVIQKRMAKAVDEISHWREYANVIINDDLDHAGAQLQAVVRAQRLAAHPNMGGLTGPEQRHALAARANPRRVAPPGAWGRQRTLEDFIADMTPA